MFKLHYKASSAFCLFLQALLNFAQFIHQAIQTKPSLKSSDTLTASPPNSEPFGTLCLTFPNIPVDLLQPPLQIPANATKPPEHQDHIPNRI